MSAHTPTPWFSDETLIFVPDLNNDLAGIDIAEAKRAADAAFIVRACNAHDDLVAALRRAVEAAEARMPCATFLDDARAALAKAGAA